MTDQTRLTVRDLIANVQLSDVRLKDSSATTHVRDVKILNEPAVSISHGTKVLHRSLTARVDKSDEVNPADPAPIQITVTFAMTYLMPDAGAYPDDVLDEFARINAVFNAWPYWREYVQSTTSRMNLPPMVLPVMRVPAPATRNASPAVDAKPAMVEGTGRRRASKGRTRRKR
jgi:hypothetical protein